MSEVYHSVDKFYIFFRNPQPFPVEWFDKESTVNYLADVKILLILRPFCSYSLCSHHFWFNNLFYHPSNMQAVLKSVTAFFGLVRLLLYLVSFWQWRESIHHGFNRGNVHLYHDSLPTRVYVRLSLLPCLSTRDLWLSSQPLTTKLKSLASPTIKLVLDTFLSMAVLGPHGLCSA